MVTLSIEGKKRLQCIKFFLKKQSRKLLLYNFGHSEPGRTGDKAQRKIMQIKIKCPKHPFKKEI